MLTKQDKYTAALYCRLSQDDGQVGESGSIQTQKALLTSYAKANGYEIFDCFSDDGFSGTNFERPEFKRMIKAIDSGKVDMVIVKDLSRFGREYAQMGLYIEHYFDQRNAQIAKKASQKYMDTLIALKTEKKKKEVSKYRRELTATEKRLGELEKILNKLYEDNALGKISDERYVTMSKVYENEQSELKEKSKYLLSEIEKADEIFTNAENFVKLIECYTDVKELNAKILNELIDRIVVYEKTENADGSKSQRVDIYYKFIGYISLGEMKQAVKLEKSDDAERKRTA